MMNTLDIRHLEPLLAQDFHYASQKVLAEIETKAEYIDYITGKLRVMDRPDARPFAEMADWDAWGGGPCVVLAQGDRDRLVATAVAEVEDGRIPIMGLKATQRCLHRDDDLQPPRRTPANRPPSQRSVLQTAHVTSGSC